MTDQFNEQRSTAIRDGLIVQAAAAAVSPWRPWRALALLIAGALVGGGVATAAFAAGGSTPLGQPSSSPVSGASPSTQREDDLTNILIMGGDSSELPTVVVDYTVEKDPKTGELTTKEQRAYRLWVADTRTISLSRDDVVDLLADAPQRARWAMLTMTCRGKGTASVGSLDDAVALTCPSEGGSSQMGIIALAATPKLEATVSGSVTLKLRVKYLAG